MEIRTKFKEQMVDKFYKRKRNFLIRLICVAFCVLVVMAYFVTPVSKVKNCAIKGNYYLSEEDVVSIMGVSEKTFLFDVDESQALLYLENHPLIEDVDINLSLINFDIEIKEISPAVQDESHIYLKDGTVFEDYELFDEGELDNLPYILNTNESYNFSDTRYILYEMALIFITKYNVDLDFIDFKSIENQQYFTFYIKPEQNYDKVFNTQNGYLQMRFEASCVADYFKDDDLLDLIGNFVREMRLSIETGSLKNYEAHNEMILNENYNVKTFNVYPEKVFGNVKITYVE